MTRGVLVAVVLSGVAFNAEAKKPSQAQVPSLKASEAKDAAATQDFRIRGPATFDVAVHSKNGRTAVYRYDRARKTASVVERLSEADVPRRTGSFTSLNDGKVVLSPEGPNKPLPPAPPGGDDLHWTLPDAERQSALQVIQALEPDGKVISIGQLPATAP